MYIIIDEYDKIYVPDTYLESYRVLEKLVIHRNYNFTGKSR